MDGAPRTLKKRSQFLEAAAKGKKAFARSLLLQALPVEGSKTLTDADASSLLVGFTTSKKLGNAVMRNRIRRRLRAAVAHILPRHAAPGYAYVVIGRQGSQDVPFTHITDDLLWALKKTSCLRRS
ncbi:MAG: ribonuclease P protein component [Alphaproteobacteria bacterium]|nr:ribonuclease P protein component [Alphaproteobacteria bacterium]